MKKTFKIFVILMAISFNAVAGLLTPDLSDWELVRRVTAEHASWHPTNDNLAGTHVYNDGNGTFSLDFEATVSNWDQILLSTGNGEHWMIFNKDQLQITGSNVPMTILSSSISPVEYQVTYYNRSGVSEDPWLSLDNHISHGTNGRNDSELHSMLYGEYSQGGYTGWHYWRENHDGANVFIRNSVAVSEPTALTLLLLSLSGLILSRKKRL